MAASDVVSSACRWRDTSADPWRDDGTTDSCVQQSKSPEPAGAAMLGYQ